MNAHAHTHTHGWLNDIYHAEKCSCYRSNRTKWGVKLYMRLIRVGSACSSSHTVMLRGPLHSVVDLTLVSKSTGNVYNIRVLRHRYHEFDFASSVPEGEVESGKATIAEATQSMRAENESLEAEISRLSASLKDKRLALVVSEGSLEKTKAQLKEKTMALMKSEGFMEKAQTEVVIFRASLATITEELGSVKKCLESKEAELARASMELEASAQRIDEMSHKEHGLQRQLEATNSQLATISRLSEEKIVALEKAHKDIKGQMQEQKTTSEKQALDLDEARSALRAIHAALCHQGSAQVQAGIGIAVGTVTVRDRKRVAVTQLAKSGPAAKSGMIKSGDIILELDGRDVTSFTVSQVKDLIRGGPGLPLRFKAQRPTSSSQYEVMLERQSGSGSSAASMSDTNSMASSAAGSSPGKTASPSKASACGSSPGKYASHGRFGGREPTLSEIGKDGCDTAIALHNELERQRRSLATAAQELAKHKASGGGVAGVGAKLLAEATDQSHPAELMRQIEEQQEEIRTLRERTEELASKMSTEIGPKAEHETAHDDAENPAVLDDVESQGIRAKVKRLVQEVNQRLHPNSLWAPHFPVVEPKMLKSTSTIGLNLNPENKVSRVLIGGPAFNSEKIQEGDVLLAIDGEVLKGHKKDAASLILGNDSVGSSCVLTIQKVKTGVVEQVTVERAANNVLEHKRRMWDLMHQITLRFQKNKEVEGSKLIAEAVQIWTKTMLEIHDHEARCWTNAESLQQELSTALNELLGAVAHAKFDEPATKVSPPETTNKMASPQQSEMFQSA